ncbi:IS3 family transposase, partial [Streptomyces sp. NPDC002547]
MTWGSTRRPCGTGSAPTAPWRQHHRLDQEERDQHHRGRRGHHRSTPGGDRDSAGRAEGRTQGERDPRHRAGHPAEGDEVFRRGDDLVTSRYRFIEDHCETYPVKRLCQVLDVVRSGFYKWRRGREARAERERADQALAEKIKAVHAESDGTYGSPRVTAELRDAAGMRINEKKVARVMRKFSIVGVHLRKKVRTTVPEPANQVVPDLYKRDFTAAQPGVKYMGDITYLPVGDGEFLYLATVLDCFSRRVVGWSIADHMRTELVADALKTATATRGSLDGAIFHSDSERNTPPANSVPYARSWGFSSSWVRSARARTTRSPRAST